VGRFLVAAVAVQDLAIYVMGGTDGVGGMIATVDIYTGPGSPWVPGPAMPTVRIYHAAGVIEDVAQQNPAIVVVGGCVGSTAPDWSNRTTVYEQVYAKWSRRADMLVPRMYPAVGVIDNVLFVAGGATVDYEVTGAVEKYDFHGDVWTMVASNPALVAAATAGVVVSVGGAPLLLVTGGLAAVSPPGSPVGTVSEFDGTNWAAGPSLATARSRHGVAVVGNGTAAGGACLLYVVGGTTLGDLSRQDGALKSVEVFVV
jgi:hypothetical protein